MTEPIRVRQIRHKRRLVNLHQVTRSNRVEVVDVNALRSLQANCMLLTITRKQTRRVVVVEERVQAGSIDQDVSAVVDAQTPGLVAGLRVAFAEVWVVVVGIRSVRCKCVGVRLHVTSIAL